MKFVGQMLLCLLPTLAEATVLNLTDVQGRNIEAEIISLENGLLTIRRASDGKAFSLPIERLDETSRKRATEAAPPPKPTSPPPKNNDGVTDTPDTPAQVKPQGRVTPVYPKELREQGITGEVVVSFIVDENGKVTSAEIFRSSDPRFNKAALDAVSQWRFEPALKDGVPVRTRVRAPLGFAIR